MDKTLAEIAAAPWRFRGKKDEIIASLCDGDDSLLPDVFDSFRRRNVLGGNIDVSVGAAEDIGDVVNVFEEEIHQYTPPIFLSDLRPERIVLVSQSENISDAFEAYVTRKGRYFLSLYGQNNVVFTRNGESITLFPEMSSFHYDSFRLFASLRGVQRPALSVGTVLVINDEFGGQNFCHWLLDWFPRLQLALRHKLSTDDFLIVLPFKPQDFHFETLSQVGVPRGRVVSLSYISDFAGGLVECERIVTFSSCGFKFQHILQRGSKALSAMMRQALGVPDTPVGNNKLIVQRREMRKLQFSESCAQKLSKYGFRTVFLEDLPFMNQRDLFASASHVIGVHGAGLANMLFVPPRTKLLEVFPEEPWPSPSTYRLSHAANFHYSCCIGNSRRSAPEQSVYALDVDCPDEYVSEWLAS